MFKKNPSYGARLVAASARKASALHAFEAAASELDAAGDAHDAIESEARSEAAALIALADVAGEHSAAARRSAAKVRDLLG